LVKIKIKFFWNKQDISTLLNAVCYLSKKSDDKKKQKVHNKERLTFIKADSRPRASDKQSSIIFNTQGN
jgi:hypothetical protein